MSRSLLSPASRGVLVALAALLALAGPGAAQDSSGTGSKEPPLGLFLDSAGLVRAVAALSAPDPAELVPPLFGVRFDSTGAVKEVRSLFEQLPASYTEPVVAAIRAHLKPQAPSRRPISTHVRVVAGPAPVVDRPTLREQAPELVNRTQVARVLERAMVARTGTLSGDEQRTELRFLVLRDGSVDSASVIVERSSGDAVLDRAAVRAAVGMRFRPATIEDIPVRVWVTAPLVFRSSDDRPGSVPPAPEPVAAVLDSAALLRALEGVPMPALPDRMKPLFFVSFRLGADSTAVTVEPVYDRIPRAYADTVAAALRASLRRDVNPWSDYVRVVAGAQPAVDRPYVYEQDPGLDNMEEIRPMVTRVARQLMRRPQGLGEPPRPGDTTHVPFHSVAVRVRVLANGRVEPGSISLPFPTGDAELDREALRIAGQMRFRPGLIDNIPVAMWKVERLLFWDPARARD